jgi:release factor glutamine methyltransferase
MIRTQAGPTGGEALETAVTRLAAAGCPAPAWDAVQLLAHSLGVDPADLDLHLDRALSAVAAQRLAVCLERRERREPLAYILGSCRFRGLRLSIDSRVLVPWEPATGVLVDVGAELPAGASVHEVGTGSGAVALALKHERPDLRVTASDISPEAIGVARENAERLGLDVTIKVFDGLPAGDYALVLANLPYASDATVLPPESDHLPRVAVVAGRDGLRLVRRLVAGAAPGTRIAVDHAPAQAEAVRGLLAGSRTLLDRCGAERATVGCVA